MSLIERAHRLLSLGLSVIPVPRAGSGVNARGEPLDGKTPVLCWKPFQSRLPTFDELVAWFDTEALNLAVITGAVSSVVVVDVDDRDAWDWVVHRLPNTPWQTETPRGMHLYFRHPSFHVSNRARITLEDGKLPLDVRGDGGFVVAPGSVHASGAAYHFAGDWTQPKSSLPVFNPDWLLRKPSSVRREEVTNQEWGVMPVTDTLTRAKAYLAVIPPPEIGRGSDAATFTAAAHLVRGFNLSRADAEALLWDWCGHRPGWTRDWVALKVKNADEHGKELRGALL